MTQTDVEITPSEGVSAVSLALYQPDIPQNLGTLLRLGACLGVPLEVIEPCGFVLDDRKLKRAGMDYLNTVDWRRHAGWSAFQRWIHQSSKRLLLLTTKAELSFHRFAFQPGDVLMLGQESAGVPVGVAEACDARLRVPMITGMRSLNIATAGALVLTEALRQLGEWDRLQHMAEHS